MRSGILSGICPLDKPETPTQALIEGPSRITRCRLGYASFVYVARPVEIALVKPIAIPDQPAQQRIEACQKGLNSTGYPGQSPTGPDMNHVLVPCARPLQES